MIEVLTVSSAEEAGAIVARAITALIDEKPDAVLGLATGSSPLPVYKALAQSGADFSRARGFALDEYVGLDPAHPESYRSVITREVVEPLGLDPALVHVPPGALDGVETAGARYEAMIREAGGVDVQLLGIGSNGHIAFNEPGSPLDSRTRREELTERTRLEERLNDLASYDPLTGALNRRALMERVESELERCSRDGAPFSLAIVDLDHFKNVNDTWGHAAGDEVLKALAEACRRALRPADVFGRFGGEEFIALLPAADADEAADIAERLRRLTEESAIATPEGVIRVTLSAGHTTALPGDSPDDLLRRADSALYESKRSGRNRVSRA